MIRVFRGFGFVIDANRRANPETMTRSDRGFLTRMERIRRIKADLKDLTFISDRVFIRLIRRIRVKKHSSIPPNSELGDDGHANGRKRIHIHQLFNPFRKRDGLSDQPFRLQSAVPDHLEHLRILWACIPWLPMISNSRPIRRFIGMGAGWAGLQDPDPLLHFFTSPREKLSAKRLQPAS